MPQNEDEEVSNHIIMARTKTEGKAMTDTLPEEKSHTRREKDIYTETKSQKDSGSTRKENTR